MKPERSGQGRRRQISRGQQVGWKTYAVAALAIVLGIVALANGQTADGLKGIVFGLALISLRDAIGKILRSIEGNRHALSDLRAAIETTLDRRRQGR